MTQLEIRKKIDENNELISKMLNPSQFVLNNCVMDKLAENRELQMQCKHEFDEDGFCVWCDKLEESND